MNFFNWLRLVAALSLAVTNSIVPMHAGFGAAAAWIFGTLISAALFSFAGGIYRIRLTAIAVLPPFIVNRTSEISSSWSRYRINQSPSETLSAMFPDTLWVSLLAFALLVALPLTIALIASHVAFKIRNVS